jgi:hypothetical protein
MKGPLKANLYAALALATAVLIGVAAGYAIFREPASGRMRSGMKQSAFEMTMLGVSRNWLLDSLGLTPPQRVVVDSLLNQAATYAETAVERMMTNVRARTDSTRDQVRSVLDDRQATRAIRFAPEHRRPGSHANAGPAETSLRILTHIRSARRVLC